MDRDQVAKISQQCNMKKGQLAYVHYREGGRLTVQLVPDWQSSNPSTCTCAC